MNKMMKKFLSAVLSTAMLVTALPMTLASAEDNEVVILEENFDDVEDVNALTAEGKFTDVSGKIEQETGRGNVLVADVGANIRCTPYNNTNLTSGQYKLSLDVKPSKNMQVYVKMRDNVNDPNGSYLYNVTALKTYTGDGFANRKGIYAGNDCERDSLKATIEEGKWYHVETIFNLDGENGKATTIISDENGTQYRRVTHKFNELKTDVKFQQLKQFVLGAYGYREDNDQSKENGSAGTAFDNIKLVKTDEVLSENFDGFASTDAFKSSAGWAKNGSNNDGDNPNIVAETGRGNVLGATNTFNYTYTLPEALESGTYKLSYDMKAATNKQLVFRMYDETQSAEYTVSAVKLYTDDNTHSNRNGIFAGVEEKEQLKATVTPGEWYHTESIINMTDKTVTTTVTDESGTVYTRAKHNFNTFNEKATFTKIKTFHIMQFSYSGTNFDGAFDNIKIEKYIAPIEPVTVEQSDITIKNGDAVQTWTNVDENAKTIVIDFGRAMDDSTLTTANIQVKNRNTNTALAYTGAYADNKYTITLTDSLAKGNIYDIVIGTDVTAADTGVVESEIKHTFKVPADATTDENVIFEENFDDKLSLDELKAKGFHTHAKETVSGALVAVSGTNQAFVPSVDNTDIDLPTLTTGMYRLSYKVRPSGTGQTLVKLYNSSVDNAYSVTNMRYDEKETVKNGVWEGTNYGDRNQNLGEKLFDTLQTDKWYEVSSIIDLDNQTVLTTVIDPDGTEKTGKKHSVNEYMINNYTADIANIKGICLASYSGHVSAYDDIKLEKYTPQLEVKKSNITIKDSEGVTQSDLTKVTPFAKTVEVAFDMDMDTATLTDNNIYITDGTNKVITTGTANGNTFTMNIEQLLETNKTYKVVVTTGVKTKNNLSLSANAEVEFTTTTAVNDNTSYSKKVYFEENFDSYAIKDYTSDAKVGIWSQRTSNGLFEIIAAPEGSGATGNVLKLAYNKDKALADSQLESVFSNVLSDGSYRITTSLKPNSTAKQSGITMVTDKAGSAPLINFYEKQLRLGDKIIAEDVDTSKWYDADIIMTVSNDGLKYTLEGTFTQKDNPSIVYTGSQTVSLDVAIKRFKAISYTATSDADCLLVDYLKLEENYPSPSIDDTSFSFTTVDGKTTKSFSDVSPLTSEITIDFGTKLKSSTVTSDNIKLYEGSSVANTVIEYTGGNTVTLHVADGVLKGNTAYKIEIGTGILNLEDVALSDSNGAGTYNFATGDDRVSGTLKAVKRNGTVVEDLEALKASTGDIIVEMDCVNSKTDESGLDIYLIVAYYKGNEMIDVKYVKSNVPGSIHTTTKSITVEASEKISEADSVKVMAWDGFDTMRPVSANITF